MSCYPGCLTYLSRNSREKSCQSKTAFLFTRPLFYNWHDSAFVEAFFFKRTQDVFFNFSEKNLCKPNPCYHHATCVETLNSFKCICEEGYKGERCKGNINLYYFCNSKKEKDMSYCSNIFLLLRWSSRWYVYICHSPSGRSGGTQGTVFPNTDRRRLVNNIFFFCNAQHFQKTRLSLGCNGGKKVKNV